MTFDEFARTRLPSLLRVAKALCVDRGTAEDVVQEVLLRAYERWDAIAASDRPEAYVRRMIVNEYLSWRRKWARVTAAPDLVDVEGTGDPAATVADRLELAGEIARLPARQRAVIVLRYMAGLSDTEIADELGCSAAPCGHTHHALSTHCAYRSIELERWRAMVTDSRTEQELVAALDFLGSNAPLVTAVLPPVADAIPSSPKQSRRLTIRLLPLAAVVVTIGVAAGIAFAPSSSGPPADHNTPATPNSVVGVWWHLQQINGREADTTHQYLSLDVSIHGSFRQSLGGCESIGGTLTISAGHLRIGHVKRQDGNCALVVRTDPVVVTDVQRLLRNDVAWSVVDSTLTLRGSGVTAVYTPYPRSGTPSRQWTYNGVGISVPASWPRNALKCGAPTTSTVIYPHAASTCTAVGDKTATTVDLGPIASTPDGLFPTRAGSPIEIDGTPATERFGRLHDGRQIAEVRVPSRNVHITITSPDAAFAAHLAEFEIYIVNK